MLVCDRENHLTAKIDIQNCSINILIRIDGIERFVDTREGPDHVDAHLIKSFCKLTRQKVIILDKKKSFS